MSQFLSIAMLIVFENNEAVIQMIIKGRSPTMRHVSRTHRVSLDWSNSQTYWQKDTSHVTNGVIFFVWSTSAISALFVAPRISACLGASPKRMAKRMPVQSEENRIVAESRPMVINLTSSVATSSSSVDSPIASRSPGILKASSRQVGLSGSLDASANPKSNPDAASSSQGWQRDAPQFISTEKSVAARYQQYSGNSEIPEGPKSQIWPHYFQNSPEFVPHLEKDFSIVRKIYDRKTTDDFKDLDVNPAIFFMSVTLQAAVHLGRDYYYWIYDPSRIYLRSLWSNYFGQEKSWSKISLRSQDCPRLIGTSLCGGNNLCCVIELFELWNRSSNCEIQNMRLYWLGAMFGRHQSITCSNLERQN